MIFQIAFLSCGFAIPSFFMVNGYLILKKDISRMKMLKKAGRYILICLVWNMILSILHFLKGEVVNPFEHTLKELFLQQGFFPQFWYLGTLILFYLFLAMGYNVVKQQDKRLLWIITSVSFLIMVCVDVLTIVSVAKNNPAIQENIPQTFRLWTWFFYFTLAHSILKLKNSERIIKSIKRKKCLIIPVICLLNIGYEYYIGYRILNIILPELFYDNLLMVITVMILFFSLQGLDIKKERIRIVVKELSANILGIYIIHLHIKGLISKMIVADTIIMQIVSLIIVFTLSAAIISVVRRIPVINKLVC